MIESREVAPNIFDNTAGRELINVIKDQLRQSKEAKFAIGNLKISLPFYNNQPDIEKQKEIASYLDGVYGKIKALKEKIQNQINQLEEMKKSILDKVFNYEK